MSNGFDLESEIRDLAARREITDCVHRYLRGLDRLDPKIQRSAFHDNALVDAGTIKGNADEFVAAAQEFLAALDGSHHQLGQVRIEMQGEHARGECYFQAWHGTRDEEGNPRDLFVAGRYIDEYSKVGGEWRIAKRRLLTDWVADNTADHGFYSANPANHRGARDGSDFSQTRAW